MDDNTKKEFSYLPNIEADKLYDALELMKWDRLDTLLANSKYERLGLDRAFIILSDLYNRFKNDKLSILDVGCNNGLLSYVFGIYGYPTLGIDSGIIDTQNRYDKLIFLTENQNGINVRFKACKLEELLASTNEKWDCALLLSVLHQFENGYAYDEKSKYSESQIRKIVNNIFKRINRVIYYECPYNEPGFDFLYGYHFLEKYLEDRDAYCFEEIAKTIGPNGVIRQLYAITPKEY